MREKDLCPICGKPKLKVSTRCFECFKKKKGGRLSKLRKNDK